MVINLDKSRKSLRQERLQKLARVLTNRYSLKLTLTNRRGLIGCCDSSKKIWIGEKIDEDELINLLSQKAVTLHEIGHLLYTNSKLWKLANIDFNLVNLIEDGRVEIGISRLYKKAKLYFFWNNIKHIPFIEEERTLLELTMELIFREAKRPMGIPQIPHAIHTQLKAELGENYEWFIQKTYKAVYALSEKETVSITKEIYEKLISLFGNQSLPKLVPNDYSVFGCGGTARKLPDGELIKPKNLETAEKLSKEIEKIEKVLNKESESELTRETNIIKSKELTGDFSNYDLEENTKIWKHMLRGREPKSLEFNLLESNAHRISHLFRALAGEGNRWKTNQKKGKLNINNITSILRNDSPRVFRRKIEIPKVELAVTILLDASGSMNYRARTATETSYIITRALELSNFKSEVVQFGIRDLKSKLHGIKSFNQKTKYSRNEFVPTALGLTPLKPALDGAEKSLNQQNTKKKVIFVITDGKPNHYGGPMECKIKVRELERNGVIVVGILINTFDEDKIFSHKIKCNDIKELKSKMVGTVKKILIS